MKAADRSGFWYGAVLFILFAMAAVLFFGRAVTEPSFWLTLAGMAPGAVAISFMGPHLAKLDRVPQLVAWFCLGVTAIVVLTLIGSKDFDLLDFVFFGALFAGAAVLAERFGPSNNEAE